MSTQQDFLIFLWVTLTIVLTVLTWVVGVSQICFANWIRKHGGALTMLQVAGSVSGVGEPTWKGMVFAYETFSFIKRYQYAPVLAIVIFVGFLAISIEASGPSFLAVMGVVVCLALVLWTAHGQVARLREYSRNLLGTIYHQEAICTTI
jgi:hypothetical protein